MGDIVGFIAIGDQTINPEKPHTWTYCILTAALALGGMSVVLLLFLNPYPYKLGVDISQVEKETEEEHIQVSTQAPKKDTEE